MLEKSKKNPLKQGVLFAPVYLVVDESNKIYQVGVYEFPAEQLENLKDDDGDLDNPT